MADGFLGRWSQRKLAVQEGKVLAEPPVSAPTATAIQPPILPTTPAQTSVRSGQAQPASASSEPAEPAPLLTLEDVQGLSSESDFSPFVARSVSPEVRNAAMKKLFTDPHYNVMDRLDIYIDDYSIADPLPESMLRQMASAKFLNLFDEEEQAPPAAQQAAASPGLPRDDADTAATDSVAQSAEHSSGTEPHLDNTPENWGLDLNHDHTDLRLQPNHAVGPQEPGRSTE